jgi:hypothetical protein
MLEDLLAREPLSGKCQQTEILNFAVNRYSVLSQIPVLEQRALPHAPDVVLSFAHVSDPFWAMNHLSQAIRASVSLPDPWLAELARRAGVTPSTPDARAERQLRPHWPELVGFAYRRIVDLSRQGGAIPVWVFLPRIGDAAEGFLDLPRLRELAREAGFVVVDLNGIFDAQDIDAISIAPWDRHPNALGHRLMRDALEKALRDLPELRALGGAAAPRADRGPSSSTD